MVAPHQEQNPEPGRSLPPQWGQKAGVASPGTGAARRGSAGTGAARRACAGRCDPPIRMVCARGGSAGAPGVAPAGAPHEGQNVAVGLMRAEQRAQVFSSAALYS